MACSLVYWQGLNLNNASWIAATPFFSRGSRKLVDKVDKIDGEVAQMGGATRARSATDTIAKQAALIEEKVLSTLLAQGSEQGGAVSQKQGRKISGWASRFRDRGCDVVQWDGRNGEGKIR